MRRLTIVILALGGLLSARGAHPQDDESAGLFTQARQLPVVSQAIQVRVAGGEAELRLVQVFANDGDAVGQADYHLYVPRGATVTGFGFWNQGTFLAAALREKKEAEERHRQAASEGRATGLLRQEGRIHTFSVYPLAAGELQKVETVLRVPVEREMGRSHVRVPVDAFLGQPGPTTTVVVDVSGEETLADFGADGGRAVTLARDDRRLQFGVSSRRAVDAWWTEKGPALRAGAEVVPLEEGDLGLQVRVAFNDAQGAGVPYRRAHLLVDGSHSMRRRAASVRTLLERVRRGAKAPVDVHLVGQTEVHFGPEATADAIVEALQGGAAGHTSAWPTFAAAVDRLGCRTSGVRCAVVSDPQLHGLDAAGDPPVPILLVADVHEMAHLGEHAPPSAGAYLPGVDAEARLLQLSDELVLPVFTVREVAQDGQPLAFPGRPSLRVAEGGILRLFTRTPSRSPVTLAAEIDGQPRRYEMMPLPLAAEDEQGRAARRGVYRELLAAWLESYRKEADADLKQRIVDVSLREGIPTAFTALQVDDPRLSLAVMKPGDPMLTVPEEPGLREVVAWYPFGEMRAMVRDAGRRAFVDRFLVPRGWPQGPYAIEVFKHYERGPVRRARVWYQLDERGPEAVLRYDAVARILHIETGEDTGHVSTVEVHTAAGQVLSLTPAAGAWLAPAADLTARFTVVLRDPAGNRTVIDCRLEGDELQILTPPAARAATPPAAQAATAPIVSAPGPLSVDGDVVLLRHDGRVLRMPAADVRLRSLELRAVARLGAETVFGTTAGDLVALRCGDDGSCRGRRITEALAHHPVVGIAPVGSDRLLVGVLGRGLYELREGGFGRSRLHIASRFVTGVAAWRQAVYVGTANDGLWVLRRGRLVRAAFPHDHVARLDVEPDGLAVTSGFGRYRRSPAGRFVRRDDGTAALPRGSARLTASADWNGRTYVGSFDRGLFELRGDALHAVGLGLGAVEAHVNVLAVFEGALWMGTEGGLLETAPDRRRARRVLPAPVHGVAAGPDGLAVATGAGLYVVQGGHVRRLDGQANVARRGFTTVAWWDGALYAGGLDGLYRFAGGTQRQVAMSEGFRAGWVTGLLATKDGLVIATYDEGVHVLKGGRVAPVPGLERQWVPPGGLHAAGAEVWVGGTGMPPLRLTAGGATAQGVPAADVYAVHGADGARVLLTSEGLLRRVEPDRGRRVSAERSAP
jgi:hypothetical protein